MKRNAILCMLSGGIDSTGALHQLLSDADYANRDLLVHHIILQNRENRAQAELDAVSRILDYYQRHFPDRPFVYTESIFNTMGFAPLQSMRFPFDMDVCAFMAANIAVADKNIREVAMGRTQTDLAGGGDLKLRMERAQRIFKSVYSLERESPPNYIFPVVNFSKAQIWGMLPDELRKLTWYCRHPSYQADGKAISCGVCSTCKEVAAFRKPIN